MVSVAGYNQTHVETGAITAYAAINILRVDLPILIPFMLADTAMVQHFSCKSPSPPSQENTTELSLRG